MTSPARYLDLFPEFLRTLPEDVLDLAELLQDSSIPLSVRIHIASGVNYLFKALDLIPDGVEDIGYLDDAFVLRFAAENALHGVGVPLPETASLPLTRIANQAPPLRDFLGPLTKRFEAYVSATTRGAARGRTVQDIVHNEQVRAELLSDIRSWVASYDLPSFTKEEVTLQRLRAFLDAKLPP